MYTPGSDSVPGTRRPKVAGSLTSSFCSSLVTSCRSVMMSRATSLRSSAVASARSSLGRSAVSRIHGWSTRACSPASSEAWMRSILPRLRPERTTALPGRSRSICSRKSGAACTCSSQRVGLTGRWLKRETRARWSMSSGASGAYTWTVFDTPGYISFCTRAAWKWPGSRAMKRISAMGELPCAEVSRVVEEAAITAPRTRHGTARALLVMRR